MKRKILVVDDEKGFSDMLKLNLESTGDYDVLTLNDPTQALAMAQKHTPDVILLDVIMPKLEGPDVAFLIHEDERLKKIPIIFLTSTVTEEEVEEQNGIIGGHPFVAKPSSLARLVEAIEKYIVSKE